MLVATLLGYTLVGCGRDLSEKKLISIALTPTNPFLAKNTSIQLVATGIYSDNTTLDLTSSVIWSSSDITKIVIDGPGRATAKAVGESVIQVSLGNFFSETRLSATPATLVSLSITPTRPSIAKGTTRQFIVTGTFSDSTTQDLTSTAAWSSSAINVATVSNAAGSEGLAASVAAGSTTITAASGGVSASTTLTVTPATLVSLDITPTNSSIAKGTARQFFATGTYSDGSAQDLTSSVVWGSSDTGVASISNAAGSIGLATSVAAGLATISATIGNTSASATLTVTPATLVSLDITPTNPGIVNGTSRQFFVTGTYSDGSTQDLTSSAVWGSSDTGVASISNAAGSKGLASSVAAGSTTISAASGNESASTMLTITPATLISLDITPTNPSIVKGTSRQFIATGTYSDNTTQDLTASVTWSSSSTGVATVSNAAGSMGLATSVAAGSTTISATSGGVSASTLLTVSPAILTSLDITPTNPSVANGTTKQFTATGTYTDSSTQDLTASVTWSSSSTGIATVSNAVGSKGLATSIAVGATTIRATSGSISASTTLTVTPATLVSVSITPTNPSIANGTTRQFTAKGTYTDNSIQDLTASVTWSSSDQGVATVSNATGSKGLASSIAVGATAIRATSGSISASTTLTVTPATLVSLAVTPTNPSIAKGTIRQFSATGTYTDSSTQDLTASVTWSSSSSGVATISNAAGSKGLATSVTSGSTTITATSGGISGSTSLTVSPAILLSLAVTPIDTTVADGTTRQFSAIGTYTDGSIQDLTAAVTWNSSSSGVATISNAAGSKGLATAVAAGSTMITAVSGGVSASTTLTVTVAASPTSVTLIWDTPTTYTDGTPVTGFVGFKVYYGTESRVYPYIVDVQNSTSWTISSLVPGTTYYFAMTAYDSSGVESDYSIELSTTIL